MKKSKRISTFIAILLFLSSSLNPLFAQSVWVKAYNSSGFYHTNPGAVFTWSGSVYNSYCHGNGTIQWYDALGNSAGRYTGGVKYGKNSGFGTQYYADGSKYYAGYWENDMFNGYGTLYNGYGGIMYQGYFRDNQMANYSDLQTAAREITMETIKSVFDGGQNVRYSVEKAVFGVDNKLTELRIRMTFNGDIISSNEYDCTLVINGLYSTPYFTDCNSNAKNYIGLKLTIGLINAIDKVVKSINRK